MKKAYLACAGIVSAFILTGMFVCIFLIPVFFSPVITIDPITDRSLDAHNRLILSGTTTLPVGSFITIKADPSVPDPTLKTVPGYPMAQGYVRVIPASGRNLWKGVLDLTSLGPAQYTMTFVTDETGENFTKIESARLMTRQFTLGDGNAGAGRIRKRTVGEPLFIRINRPDEKAPAVGARITGITSLEPGTPLKWQVDKGTSGFATFSTSAEGVTQVSRGTEGINRWSFAPNLTDILPAPIRVSVTKKTANGTDTNGDELSATGEFNLTGSGTEPADDGHGPGFITIDSLPDLRQNSVFIISGTTSLPPENNLTFIVLPYSSGTEIDLMVDPVTKAQVSRNPYTGTSGMVKVAEGDGRTNFWAFQLETYLMDPGTYEVQMNNDKYDFTNGSLISGGLSTSRVFTLQEQLS